MFLRHGLAPDPLRQLLQLYLFEGTIQRVGWGLELAGAVAVLALGVATFSKVVLSGPSTL